MLQPVTAFRFFWIYQIHMTTIQLQITMCNRINYSFIQSEC